MTFHRSGVQLDVPAMKRAMDTPKAAAWVSRKTTQIAMIARNDAPKNKQLSWNAYWRSISTAMYHDGLPHGIVQADRHALVVEYGWRNKWSGKKYPGRHVLKKSMIKARE